MSEDEIKQLAENAIPANGLIDKMDWKGYINQLKIQWIDGYKAALASITHLEDEDHVFEVTDSEGNKSGVYFYNDNNGFNQHSKLYETKELALKAYRESIVTPSLQSGVEDAAKAHADKNSYQSDKHQFTITPWIQNNWAISDFKAGAEWQAQQVNSVMQWTSIKPELNKECILLTASEYKKEWSYTTFLITKIDSYEGWYWGLCDIDGKEWGDIDDLKADLYQVVELPETIIQ